MNWSGGKDSSLCLYEIFQEKKLDVKYLLTSINQATQRISMHGVRTTLLEAQAEAIGIPLKILELPEETSMIEYDARMAVVIDSLRHEEIKYSIFGDIFLEDLRKYREEKLVPHNMKGIFPLWKKSTTELMQQFLALGFKAIVVCVNEDKLGKSFCGKIINEEWVNSLPPGVDICGENGEYHSFVFDGPIFKKPIAWEMGEMVYREYKAPQSDQKNVGFYFTDLLPA